MFHSTKSNYPHPQRVQESKAPPKCYLSYAATCVVSFASIVQIYGERGNLNARMGSSVLVAKKQGLKTSGICFGAFSNIRSGSKLQVFARCIAPPDQATDLFRVCHVEQHHDTEHQGGIEDIQISFVT